MRIYVKALRLKHSIEIPIDYGLIQTSFAFLSSVLKKHNKNNR